MAYTEIVCHHCHTKQMLMVSPSSIEIRCSACAKMISVPILVEKLQLEAEREEANKKQIEEQALVAKEAEIQPKVRKKGRKKNAK